MSIISMHMPTSGACQSSHLTCQSFVCPYMWTSKLRTWAFHTTRTMPPPRGTRLDPNFQWKTLTAQDIASFQGMQMQIRGENVGFVRPRISLHSNDGERSGEYCDIKQLDEWMPCRKLLQQSWFIRWRRCPNLAKLGRNVSHDQRKMSKKALAT